MSIFDLEVNSQFGKPTSNQIPSDWTMCNRVFFWPCLHLHLQYPIGFYRYRVLQWITMDVHQSFYPSLVSNMHINTKNIVTAC